MKQLTFFINNDSGKYFLLDPVGKTLNAISNSDKYVLIKYQHLMNFSGEIRYIHIPDYKTMKQFQKHLKNADLTNVDDPALYLVNEYPEYFI